MDNSRPTYIYVLIAYDHSIKAWTNVKMSTIINCFKKCKFSQRNATSYEHRLQTIV